MKKNQLTTTKSTSLVLGKSKSLLGITKKLLQNKAVASAPKGNALAEHEGITLIGNLMWENISYSQEEENAYKDQKSYGHVMDWHEAMAYAKNLRLGGYDDWRLPTIEELKEVVTLCGGEFARRDDDDRREKADRNIENALYQEAYKVKGFSSCWSSTTYANSNNVVWIVSFHYGAQSKYLKDYYFYVRCVRAG